MMRYACKAYLLFLVMILVSCSPTNRYKSHTTFTITPTTKERGEGSVELPKTTQQTRQSAIQLSTESVTKSTATMAPGVGLAPPSIQADRKPIDEFEICSPLADIPIDELADIVSAPYEPPPPGKEDRHHGVDFSFYRRGDIASILGMGVQTVMASKVVMVLADSFPYGNAIMLETAWTALPKDVQDDLGIEHGEALYILYAHLSDPPSVALMESLPACDIVGFVGKSGNAGVPHLHMETRIGPSGEVFEGMSYYSTQTTPEERSNYTRWRTGGEFTHFDPVHLYELHASSLSPQGP